MSGNLIKRRSRSAVGKQPRLVFRRLFSQPHTDSEKPRRTLSALITGFEKLAKLFMIRRGTDAFGGCEHHQTSSFTNRRARGSHGGVPRPRAPAARNRSCPVCP